MDGPSGVRPYLFVSERVPEPALSVLAARFRTVRLPAYGRLPEPVASHPDMLLLPLGNKIYAYREYAKANADLLENAAGLTPVPDVPGGVYPRDILLNMLCAGNALIGRTDMIPAAADVSAFRLFPVRQGYARCSTLLCGDCAVTADRGIAGALTGLGLSVLAVSPGGISLPGYGTGFIGGASFCFGGEAWFFGDPASHPDGPRILAFLEKNGCPVHTLPVGGLTDFGGAVAVCP